MIKPISFIFLFAVFWKLINSPAENEVVDISPVYTQRKYIETKHMSVKKYSLSIFYHLLHEIMLPCIGMTLLSSSHTWFTPARKKSVRMNFIVNNDPFFLMKFIYDKTSVYWTIKF